MVARLVLILGKTLRALTQMHLRCEKKLDSRYQTIAPSVVRFLRAKAKTLRLVLPWPQDARIKA